MSTHGIHRVQTTAIALLGAGGFYLSGLPLPFLFGPMAACLVAALAGRQLKDLGGLSKLARSFLGVAAGTAITPEVLDRIPGMVPTLALVPVYVALIGLVGVPFFRARGYDRMTAWYGAMPGGLQDMILFGKEAGADVRALSLIHVTRVLVIVTVAPILLNLLYGVSLTRPVGAPAAQIPPSDLGLMVFSALVGWKAAERIGMFGATILGPMILSAILTLSGLIEARPPLEAVIFAQFVIGLGIGVSYVGVTFAELRRVVLSGIAFVMILAALAAGFTELVRRLGLADPVEAFLSFAPGGQAEMVVLAIVSGADLGFVIVHHLARIVLVILGAPIAVRWFMRD